MRKKFSHDLIGLSVWNKIDFNQYKRNGYQSTKSVPRKCYYGIKQPILQYQLSYTKSGTEYRKTTISFNYSKSGHWA